jgi:uncharacterized membrane protein
MGLGGITDIAWAATLWASRPPGTPANEGVAVAQVLDLLIVGTLFLFGVMALAIGVLSTGFGFLVRTQKRRALWAVVVGESLVAIVLVGAGIWALTHAGDAKLAIFPAVFIALVSAPVLFLIGSTLARGTPTDAG